MNIKKNSIDDLIEKDEEKPEFMPPPKYDKIPIPEIIGSIKTVNLDSIAEEVLTWVTNNVEYFIDNQRKTFKLDLAVDTVGMPETKKLQDLYRAIPEDDTVIPKGSTKDFKELLAQKKVKKGFKAIQDCREELDKATSQVHEIMTGKKELLEKLFSRMIFFYEMVGISNGKPLIREMNGGVEILKFEYEAFPVAIKVKAPNVGIRGIDGSMKSIEGASHEYVIPEGFTIWIEIAYRAKMANTGMF